MAEFMEKRLQTTSNFISNMRSMIDNTLNFKNCSYLEKYENKNMLHMEKSEKGLIYFRNIIQEKYLFRLLKNRTIVNLNDTQRNEYDMNPYLAASELLGNRDYWWLVLMVNKKMNVESFSKLSSHIYIPDITDLRDCLIKELNKNKDLGVIK